jgi:type IV pilus modification protein PilV
MSKRSALARVARRGRVSGFSLVETLVAFLLFAIGVLALLAMYAQAIGSVSDTQQRSDAALYTNELLNTIWTQVQRDNTGSIVPASIARFAYQPQGDKCGEFAGASEEATVVKPWLQRLVAEKTGLPGAGESGMQQILVESGASNRVTVTVCWKNPQTGGIQRQQTVAHIN